MLQNNIKFSQLQKHYMNVLKTEAKSRGITQAQLADRTGMQQATISRAMDSKFNLSFIAFLSLVHAIGCKVIINFDRTE